MTTSQRDALQAPTTAEVERDRALELLAEARGYLSCADCGHPSCNQADLAARIDALVESVATTDARPCDHVFAAVGTAADPVSMCLRCRVEKRGGR